MALQIAQAASFLTSCSEFWSRLTSAGHISASKTAYGKIINKCRHIFRATSKLGLRLKREVQSRYIG